MLLMEEIDDTIKQLKKLDAQESSAHDAKTKVKNDKDYSKLVQDVSNTIEKMDQSSSLIEFIPSDETLKLTDEAILKLENVIHFDEVDETELNHAKKQNNELTVRLSKEWKKAYQSKVAKTRAKLSSISSLIEEKNKINRIQNQIVNASEWTGLLFKDNGNQNRLECLKQAIEEVDQIEGDLDLSEGVRAFLERVTKGKARVTELTPEIMMWIKKEKMEDKFTIDFKI